MDVELLSFLKRSLGVIIRRLEEAGVRPLPLNEHAFLPEIEVSDRQVEVAVQGVVWKIKNLGDYPVFFNIDRPVTPKDYGLVPPKGYVVVGRLGGRVYLKAPEGQRCVVKVDALRWS